ncbi:TPA: hypothetical protein ACIRVE_005098 [Pseudomonas putida]
MTHPLHAQPVAAELDTFGLMFCLQADGSYAATEHGDLMTFEHKGCAITNPCCDESSTVTVDPRRYGFTDTESAKEALRRELDGGNYLLLTDLECPQSARLSRCDGAGRVLAYCFLADVP